MKQYVIDELRPDDYKVLKKYLDENHADQSMDGLYWIPLDTDQLSDVQLSHKECQPFFFAIELLPDRLVCELLVRTKNNIRCECIGYATETQRNWIIRILDAIFEKLELIA